MAIEVYRSRQDSHIIMLHVPETWDKPDLVRMMQQLREGTPKPRHTIVTFPNGQDMPDGFFQVIQALEASLPSSLHSLIAVMDWQAMTLVTRLLKRVAPTLSDRLVFATSMDAALRMIQSSPTTPRH